MIPACLLAGGEATALVTVWPAPSVAQGAAKIDGVYAGDGLRVVSGGQRHNGRWIGRRDILVDGNLVANQSVAITARLDLMALQGGGLSANEVGDSVEDWCGGVALTLRSPTNSPALSAGPCSRGRAVRCGE